MIAAERVLRLSVLALPLALGWPQAARPAARGASAAAAVATRAIVRSIADEDGGGRLLIRLKLVPRGKLPFTTITYRVLDRQLVAGLKEGDSVAFVARRVDGENVLTSIRRVPPCERFRKCDEP